jgi:hypothetical protein
MAVISTYLGDKSEFIYYVCIISFFLILYLLYSNSKQKENFNSYWDPMTTRRSSRRPNEDREESKKNIFNPELFTIDKDGNAIIKGNLVVNGRYIMIGPEGSDYTFSGNPDGFRISTGSSENDANRHHFGRNVGQQNH